MDLTSAFLRFVSRLDGHAVALSLALILMIVSLVISLSAAATVPGRALTGSLPARSQPSRSTTWSMQLVSASTSLVSIAGYIAIRSWFRPSLRYGSVSTIPLARSTAATWSASIDSSKSMVPITSERWDGSGTYGVVYDVRSAQP